MATPILTRDADTDDDGTGTTGTVHNNAWKTAMYNRIDAVVASLFGASVGSTVTLTDGATPALDASLGPVFRLAAAGDRTIAVPSNATSGQRILIQHYASGGARTLALNTGAGGFRFGSTITTISQTVSGKTDYIEAVYNATDSKWDVILFTKGF